MRCTLVPMSGVGSLVDPAPTPEHVAFASRLGGIHVHLSLPTVGAAPSLPTVGARAPSRPIHALERVF